MDNQSRSLQSGLNAVGTAVDKSTLVFKAMIVLDAAGLSLWMADWISTPQLFGLHLLGVGVLLVISVLLSRETILPALSEAGFCLLAGPLGTLVLQIARLGRVLPATNPENLGETDDYLLRPVSVPDAIHEMHVQGRRSKPQATKDQTYADIIRHGDLPRHNEIIAAISRNYTPEMYPALSLALGSSSPALKVQAAAVFSKLRRTMGDAANDLLATNLATLPPDAVKDCYERLLNVARSGFVDANKVQALRARAVEIEALGLVEGFVSDPPKQSAHHTGQHLRDMRKRGPRVKRYSCGGLG